MPKTMSAKKQYLIKKQLSGCAKNKKKEKQNNEDKFSLSSLFIKPQST